MACDGMLVPTLREDTHTTRTEAPSPLQHAREYSPPRPCLCRVFEFCERAQEPSGQRRMQSPGKWQRTTR